MQQNKLIFSGREYDVQDGVVICISTASEVDEDGNSSLTAVISESTGQQLIELLSAFLAGAPQLIPLFKHALIDAMLIDGGEIIDKQSKPVQ